MKKTKLLTSLTGLAAIGLAASPIAALTSCNKKVEEFDVVIPKTTDAKVKKQEIKDGNLLLTLESTKTGKIIADVKNVKRDGEAVESSFDKSTQVLTIALNSNSTSNSLGKITFDIVMEYEVEITGQAKVESQEFDSQGNLTITLAKTATKNILGISEVLIGKTQIPSTYYSFANNKLTIKAKALSALSGNIRIIIISEYDITVTGNAIVKSQSLNSDESLEIVIQPNVGRITDVSNIKIGDTTLTSLAYEYADNVLTIYKTPLKLYTGTISFTVTVEEKQSIGKQAFLNLYATYLANFKAETKHYNLDNLVECIYNGEDVTSIITAFRYDYNGDQQVKTFNILKYGSAFGSNIGGMTVDEVTALIMDDGQGVFYEKDETTGNIIFTYTNSATSIVEKKLVISSEGIILEDNDKSQSLTFSLKLTGQPDSVPSFTYNDNSGTNTKIAQRTYSWKQKGNMYLLVTFDKAVDTTKITLTRNGATLSPLFNSDKNYFFVDVEGITGQEAKGFELTYAA